MVIPGTEMDYDVETEVWNIYELDDGTTIKIRTVLTKLIRDPHAKPPPGADAGSKGVGFQASFSNILVTHSAKLNVMGPPRTRPEPLPEAETIDVGFTAFAEGWNVYKLKGEGVPKGMKIRVKLVVSSIVKAIGHFDQFGYPLYRVRSTNAVVPVTPEPRKRKRR